MDGWELEEIKRHFGVVAEDLRADIRAVAEAVAAHREEFRREIEDVRTEVRAGFAAVKTFVRLAVGDLNRRVGKLESDRPSDRG